MVTILLFSMDWSNRVLRTFVIDQANYKSITKYPDDLFSQFIQLQRQLYIIHTHTEFQPQQQILIIAATINFSFIPFKNIAQNPANITMKIWQNHISSVFFSQFMWLNCNYILKLMAAHEHVTHSKGEKRNVRESVGKLWNLYVLHVTEQFFAHMKSSDIQMDKLLILWDP